jgi:hypothetical protein
VDSFPLGWFFCKHLKGLVDPAAEFEDRGQKAAGTQLGNQQFNVANLDG